VTPSDEGFASTTASLWMALMKVLLAGSPDEAPD
jgi:hypothetical protein